jgi:cellulose synthase/poly-beta-1,6-N-acetylglucosamine synthase-like glycosyltransferase
VSVSAAGITDWLPDPPSYRQWQLRCEAPVIARCERDYRDHHFDAGWPLLSVIIPTFNTPPEILGELLDSLSRQLYPRWEACITDDASTTPGVTELIEARCTGDSRFRLQRRSQNGGIAQASNDALARARGDFVAFVDHDDRLAPHALLLVAEEIRRGGRPGLLYSDSDELSTAGERCNPFFKPDWNYELFLGQNYLNHLSVFRRDLVEEVGGLRPQFDRSQDYDLALRVVEKLDPAEIVHLPHILYHWRNVPSSAARSRLGEAVRRAREAVREHLQRTGQCASVEPAPGALLYNRIRWRAGGGPPPAVAAVVYGADPTAVERTAAQLERNSLAAHGIVCDGGALQVPAAQLNEHIKGVDEEVVLLMQAGLTPLEPLLPAQITAAALRDDVGLVAPKLVSARHCRGPLLLGEVAGSERRWARSAFTGADVASKGCFGRLVLQQQASAASAACLILRTDAFRRSGGFSSELACPTLLGADLSLKLAECGLRVIWDPDTTMVADEALFATLDGPPQPRENALFGELWPALPACDPFYNPNLPAGDDSYRWPGR